MSAARFSPDSRFLVAALGWEVPLPMLLERGDGDKVLRSDNPLPHWAVWELSARRAVRTIPRHHGATTCLDFSPVGKYAAAGTVETRDSGSVGVWDTTTGKLVHRFDASLPPVTCVCWSRDGKWLAAGGENLLRDGDRAGDVRIWDAASHQEVFVLNGPQAAVSLICFSPDRKLILGAGRDNIVRVWEVAGGKLVAELKGQQDRVTSADFSPDGERIVTGCADLVARLWLAKTGQLAGSFRADERGVRGAFHHGSKGVWYDGPHLCALFSADGKRILTGGNDGTVRVWDVRTGQEIIRDGRLEGEKRATDSIRTLAFVSQGQVLQIQRRDGSGNRGGRLELWDASARSDAVAADQQGVFAVSLSPDGEHFATNGMDKTIRLWELGSCRPIGVLEGIRGSDLFQACYSPDGKRLLVLGVSQSQQGAPVTEGRIWDTTSGQEVASLDLKDRMLFGAAFSPDGKQLVGGSQMLKGPDWKGSDTKLHIWDAATGKEMRHLEGHKGFIVHTNFSPDGSRLLSSASTVRARAGWPYFESGELKLWDWPAGKELRSLRADPGGLYLPPRFSSDGRHFACGQLVTNDKWQIRAGALRIFETATGKLIRSIDGRKGSIVGGSFSPDGKQLACTEIWGSVRDIEGAVYLVDATTGEFIRSLEEGAGDSAPLFLAAEFDPSGRWILTGRWNGEFALRVAQTGQEMRRFRGQRQEQFEFLMQLFLKGHTTCFSSDGKWLIWPEGDSVHVLSLEGMDKQFRLR